LPPGTYGDGNNLYLVVKDSGARSYTLRYYWHGRPQKMGLGPTRDVTLAEARDAAIDANRMIAKGINPREARDGARIAEMPVLFLAFAEEFRLARSGLQAQGSQSQVEAHRAGARQTAAQEAHRPDHDQGHPGCA
jgi:hypothetical protein